MTREEVLEITLQVIKGKMWWETNGEVIIEVALAAAEHEREQYEGLIRELLEALRICSGFVEAFGEPEIRAMVREAIAKARGKA